jgi:hypothetical protein
VGQYTVGVTTGKTLILHWNGTKWAKAASPNPSGSVTALMLNGVSATSARNVWAIGTYMGAIEKTITMRWNGSAWKIVANPSPGQEPDLAGVSAISAGNAWAVGTYLAGSTHKTLIMHWNGKAWSQVASPAPGSFSGLTGVTASSASNVWAVGSYDNAPGQVLAIHCC